jgi:serine/threonine protein kinase
VSELNAIAKKLAVKDNLLHLPGVSTLNDRYALKKKIGEGGLCEVWSAVDKRADYFGDRRNVAVKIPSKDMKAKRDIAAFLYAEYRFLVRVSHPNAVRALNYDIDRKSKIPFIVMELLSGRQMLNAAAELSTKEKIAVSARLSQVVCHIHSLGIVHADINPSNIIVRDGNDAKLLDFGVAVDLRESRPFHLNRKDIKAFNPLYAAPEVIDGETPTIKSDIFSLAATLFECFGSGTIRKESPEVPLKTPVSFSRLKAIPVVLRLWFYRALNADPRKRPFKPPAVFKKVSWHELLRTIGML